MNFLAAEVIHLSQSILPITPYIADAVPDKKAPWRISGSVSHRMELKPFDKTSSFKKCVLLSSDTEMEFVRRYFDQGKPLDLKIRRVYCLDNPVSIKTFEEALSLMEADVSKKDFQPNRPQEEDSSRRKEFIGRWKSMGDLFGPFELEDSEISHVKAFPLWHGSDFDKCLSIASNGFTFLGKDPNFNTQAQKEASPSPDYGYFESGIYFTNSPKYASLQNPHHGLLSWVIMSEPYLIIHDKPHLQKGSDIEIPQGKEVHPDYNTHYIPLASADPSDPKCVEYYPSYDEQKASLDEFVVFEKAQAVARLWVELTLEGSDPSYTISEMMASVEEGDLIQVQTWIKKERSRLQAKTEEGETLPYAALSGDKLSLLEWLHTQDPSLIHETRHDGRSLPFLAVLGGRKEILDFLLEKGICYSSSRFNEEAKTFGYSKQRIAKALASVNWSIRKLPPKNSYFSGREDVFNELKNRFSSDPFQSLTKVALVGVGGMGKSTLAIAYAHTFQSRYSLIYWIEAEKSPQSGLKDLGIELGLAKIDTPDKEAVKKVLSYLNQNPGWLLIFDNMESSSFIKPLFHPFGKGHILITSPDTSWPNGLPVSSLSSEGSLSLLTKRTGYPGDKEAEKLAEELGHLPLALTQAGAYMAETKTSYRSYLELYLQEKKELTSQRPLPKDYPHSLAKTWKISLDKLKITSPESLSVLYRALYLAPDKIPKALLSDKGSSSLELNNALKTLKNYSLLFPGEEAETFSIHRLVQTTLRNYLSLRETEKTKKILQETLKKEWDFDYRVPSTWIKAKTLVSHLEAFVTLEAGKETPHEFFIGLGRYFNQFGGESVRSIDFLNRSLQAAKKLYGEKHPDVAISLDNLGLAHKAQGKLSEAIEFHSESLRIRRELYEENHPDVAISLDNLGKAHKAQGNLHEAIDYYEMSLKIRNDLYGEEHPDIAINFDRLGNAYKYLRRIPDAIEFYKKSLQIRKKLWGEEHPDIVISLDKLGNAYKAQKKISEAIGFYEKSIEVRRKFYGEEHPDVADGLNKLGVVYFDQDKFLEAINSFEESLKITKKLYGEEHGETAVILNNLGHAYCTQDRLSEAISYSEESIRINKKLYGEELPSVAHSLSNLGNAHHKQGKFPEAIRFYEESLRIHTKLYGEEHLSVANSLSNLGDVYKTQNNFPEAIRLYKESLRIQTKLCGENHSNTVINLVNLGNVYRIQKKLPEAIVLYEKALEISERTYGEKHQNVPNILGILGYAYQAQGKLTKAVELYKRSIRIEKKLFGEEHPDVAISLNYLGSAYKDEGKLREAVECYEESLQIRKKFHGEEHPNVVDSLLNLGKVYEDQGNARAIRTGTKALEICKRLYGNEHPDVANSLLLIGKAYLTQGNASQGIKFYEESLKIREKLYGREHLDMAVSYNQLGDTCKAQGKFLEAIKFYEESLQIKEKLYGREHLDVAVSYNQLGDAYKAQGKFLEAIKFYEESLQIKEKLYGREHLDVAVSYNQLGDAYKAQGKFLEAIEFYERSLQIREKLYEGKHRDVAISLDNLGDAYKAQGKFLEAIEFYERSLEIKKKLHGEKHPDVADSFNYLGNAYKAQNKFREAISFFEESLQIRKEFYGKGHSKIASSLSLLGATYQLEGNSSKAIAFCEESLEIFKEIYSKEDSIVADTISILGSAYEAQGDLSKAVGFYERCLRVEKKLYGEGHPNVAISLDKLNRCIQMMNH